MFFVLRAIDSIVPDVPESLELKIKRERYLAKQALAENHEALLVSRGQRAASATPGTSSAGQWNIGHTHARKTCQSSPVIRYSGRKQVWTRGFRSGASKVIMKCEAVNLTKTLSDTPGKPTIFC